LSVRVLANNMNTRAIAATVIDRIITQGASLTQSLRDELQSIEDPRDRAFIQALTYGVCRFCPRLDFIASQLLKKPIKQKDRIIHALLLVGLYQLTESRTPAHAAIDETVNAAKQLKRPWATGVINAVLRNYQRDAENLNAATEKNPVAKYAHPQWLIDLLQEAWPNDWESVLTANNEQAPLTLRVNLSKISCDDYVKKLADAEIKATPLPNIPSALMLDTPQDVTELPGFEEGEISVQDGAAQLAATFLELAPGQRILDACAAPGGKTCHILETEPDLAQVIAIDSDAERLELVEDNLARLDLEATCLAENAIQTEKWWDGEGFDRILLDAPCSGTGVIRRHPDIKLLRETDDILVSAQRQRQLLEALWPLLKPGGHLLYATCSILPQENALLLEEFVAAHPEAEEYALPDTWGQSVSIGRQLLPGQDNLDGFYYGRVKKRVT